MLRARRFHRLHPVLAMLIVLATMLARVAVPGGFMPMAIADGRVVLAPCSGHVAAQPTASHHRHGDPAPHGSAAGARCAFADLAVPLADGDVPVLAAIQHIAIAAPFIAPEPDAAPRPAARQRPPLRGPPLAA